jgi:hypothetical protein
MKEIIEYLSKHAEYSMEPQDGFVDLGFMFVKAKPSASAEALKSLLEAFKESSGLDLFDRDEHSYIEIGGYFDSQKLALITMGLGADLGLWKVLSPLTMLKVGNRTEIGESFIGQGMLTVMAIQG